MVQYNGHHAAVFCFGIAGIFLCSTAAIFLLYVNENAQNILGEKLETSLESNGCNTASLNVYIPPGRNDDFYQIVDVTFDGQVLPLAIDTSFADTFFATDDCDRTSRDSGCYRLRDSYKVDQETRLLPQEIFNTTLGFGRVIGNLSSNSVDLGNYNVGNITTALIQWAARDEFQNGSFSGVLGLGLRTVSLAWWKYRRLPLIDTLISQKAMKKPVFSLRSPRYGDPEQKTGMLTLSAVEDISEAEITYRDVVPFSRTSTRPSRLETYGWSASLCGLRINGVQVAASTGRFRSDVQHVAVIDAGAPYIYLPGPDFHAILRHFDGVTVTEKDPGGDKAYFECNKPQLLEVMLHHRWFAVDPLDMLVANSRRMINGTAMCQASLRCNMMEFGDTLLGLPFLRSVFAVFDYVSMDMYAARPKLGLASLVNGDAAVDRYGSVYLHRL